MTTTTPQPAAPSAMATDRPRYDPVRGFTFSLIGTIFLACNYVTAKYGLGGFNPETLAVTWMGAATVYAFIWAAMNGQVRQLVLRGPDLRWMLLLGLANAACQLMLWKSLNQLDPSFAAFLGRFAPLMAILMGAVLLKEMIRPLEWAAVALMIGGGAWSSGGSFQAEWVGITLALASAFFSAAQWPIAKHGGRNVPGVVMNFYRVAIAAITVTIWALVAGKFDISHVTPRHWAVTLVGSLIGPFLSYLLMFRSYDFWPMSRSAIVWTLQPLIVLPLAWLVFGSVPSGSKLVGGLITLAGAFWLAILHRQQAPSPIED